MATRDFKIRNGLDVGGDITYKGGTITVFDSESVINIIKDVGINESDLATVATLRDDVDSDSAAIQQNLTDLTSDISTINTRLDSDETTIQTIMNSIYENNRFQNILKARRKLFFYLVYQIGYPIYYFQIY